MQKRIYSLIFLLCCMLMPAGAVLQEDSLQNSLAVLRQELTKKHYRQREKLNRSKVITDQVMKQLIEIGQKSSQVSLMLYSQTTDNVFDLTYACHEATSLWQDFQTMTQPFHDIVEGSKTDIARYDSLITVLSTMYMIGMSEKNKTDRNVCLTLAVSIRKMLQENNNVYKEYAQYYHYYEGQLKSMNDYAQARYKEFQTGLFAKRGDSYFSFLKNFKVKSLTMSAIVAEKYLPKRTVKSQWDVMWLIGLFSMILIYGLIAVLINYLSIRFLVSKILAHERFAEINKGFLAKRTCIIITASVVAFALILIIIRFFSQSNFVNMACSLLLEFTWLLAVVFGSLLLRVDGSQIHATYKIYYPLIFIGFLVIAFRIVMLPGSVVNLIYPPLLLITAVWQLQIIYKYSNDIPKTDLRLSYFSFAVFAFAVISSWIGFIYLSVQVIIWWTMQLACLLTITCIRDYLKLYKEQKDLSHSPVSKAWFFRLIYYVVLPASVAVSFILAVYWAAAVFNLSTQTWEIVKTNFIDTQNFKISVFGIILIVVLWYVFNYINHTLKDFITLYLESNDPSTAVAKSVMIFNVLQVVIWGAWLLTALSIFKVNSTWLVVVSGGLSTGIGFAMKDILENIYYGISLMAGRIKIGDLIVCDGIRGKVSSINYTSTIIEASDGSVIAFQNSQLFTKNYKNLTKNNGQELVVLEVGVAYGTNINHVKKLLVDAISQLDCMLEGREVKVVMSRFDDSCITLKVIAWLNVLTQFGDSGIIMECIYTTLNDNGIEIPFPQRDINIRHIEAATQEDVEKEVKGGN